MWWGACLHQHTYRACPAPHAQPGAGGKQSVIGKEELEELKDEWKWWKMPYLFGDPVLHSLVLAVRATQGASSARNQLKEFIEVEGGQRAVSLSHADQHVLGAQETLATRTDVEDELPQPQTPNTPPQILCGMSLVGVELWTHSHCLGTRSQLHCLCQWGQFGDIFTCFCSPIELGASEAAP